MILVNVLIKISKVEVDSVRRQVCAPTATVPAVLDEDEEEDLQAGTLLPLKDAGPGYAAPGSSGYADDTPAVALGTAYLEGTVPWIEEWLQVTGLDILVDKSCS